jgi:hypothetical protein
MPDDNNPWRDVDIARAGQSVRRGYGLPGGNCLTGCSMFVVALLVAIAAIVLVLS